MPHKTPKAKRNQDNYHGLPQCLPKRERARLFMEKA
jgi:hypothetical protein